MPFTYAVGQSFHNANETIVRCVALPPGARYFGTRNSAGFVTLPTLDTGVSYTEIQGIQNLNWSNSDKDQKFRLIGDGGWEDSRKTGASWQASITSFLMKAMEFSTGSNVPSFRGAYEEGYRIIELASQTADSEIYLEILQDLGQANGTTGNYIYSFTGVNCSVQNLKPGVDPQNLTNLAYDLIGRGEVISGLYDAGSTPLSYGSLQTGLLQTFNATLSTGTRRYAPVPADNATAIVVSAPLTVTFTSNGTLALAHTSLGQADGSGFRLELASTGVQIPATVAFNSTTAVATITPTASLPAATNFKFTVRDGAVTQAVDSSGVASATGTRRALGGFSTSFRTA
jgi:hypothetical protein